MTSNEIRSLGIAQLARAFRDTDLTSVEATQAYFEAIDNTPDAITSIYRVLTKERALAQAKQADDNFAQGIDKGLLQGIPLALKDLLDTKGEVTAAGSKVYSQHEAATEDCPLVARLDAAGAVFLGKTNMTEFAFSGLGLNPHFGTAESAVMAGAIPGGSSSGSGVAVGLELACAAIGSDTGGSVRIPSCYNGLVGLKTSDGLIPKDGVTPLSTTLDTIGPMTRTVEDAAILFSVMNDASYSPIQSEGISEKRFLVPTTVVLDNLDTEVEAAFNKACEQLEALGAVIERVDMPELQEVNDLYGELGSFATHESYAIYQDVIKQGDGLNGLNPQIDYRVSARIVQFEGSSSSDYINLHLTRKDIIQRFWNKVEGYEAVLCPTMATLPPQIADLAEDEAYFKANGLCLRNTQFFNFMSGPSLSVPLGEKQPIGLMISTPHGEEIKALAIGQVVERLQRNQI